MKAKLESAWEWVKTHWQWILFPVGILLFILGRGSKSAEVITTDPTKKADDRAKVERERREAELAAEQARLRARLDEVHQENAGKLQKLTEEQMGQAAELEQDPEKLNEWLRSL